MSTGGKEEAELDKFRESLKDVVSVLDRFSPFFRTVEEMHAGLSHGLENDGQLRLLLAAFTAKR